MLPHCATTRCLSLLEKCKTMEHLKQAHSLLFTVGLGSNTFALSRVLAFCSDPRRGSHSYAWNLFQHIQNPTICIWNTMFKAFLLHNQLVQTVNLYREMLRIGKVVCDNYTIPYVLKACARLQSSLHGQCVHGQALKSSLEFDIFVGNSLLAMYVEFRDMESAGKVFDEMPELSLVSWTIMISGYGKAGEVERARLFFDVAPARDKAVWGAMISGYVQNARFKEALSLFRAMQLETEIESDEAIFVSALCACAHLGGLKLGIWIHRRMDWLGLSLAVRSGTGLIDMYAKCGDLDSAEKIFREMPIKDTACWNAMISAFAFHGRGGSALELFSEMEMYNVGPDDVTFIAIISACSHTGLISEGLRILETMCRVYGIEMKSEHYGCIVDLLGRAGLLEEAKRVVEIEPTKDESCWRAFLGGCVKHGRGSLAGIASEIIFGRSDCESGSYVLLSNLYAISGEVGGAGRVRSLMRSRDVEKVPGCSSVEVNGVVHEFVMGEKIHRNSDEICSVLQKINKHF